MLSTCALFSMAQVDTEFWFAAPWMNSHHTGEADFHMILSAYDQDTKVTITQPAWQNRILVDTTILAHSYCDIIIGPRTDHKQYAEANLEAPYNKIAPRDCISLLTNLSRLTTKLLTPMEKHIPLREKMHSVRSSL